MAETTIQARLRDAFRLQPSRPGDLWLFYRFIGSVASALAGLGLVLWLTGRGDAHAHGGIFGFITGAYCVVPAITFLVSARQLRREQAPTWWYVWMPLVVVAGWTYVFGRALGL